VITYREAKYIIERTKGFSKGQSLRNAGFTEGLALNPQLIETQEMRDTLEAFQQELAAQTFQIGLVDATEILEQLTQQLRGDLAELYDESGTLLPIPQWPEWARKGGVEVIDEPNLVRSSDGENSSWDVKGRKIRVRSLPKDKVREQAMRHIAVRAMQESGALNVTVNNITIAERLREARERVTKSKQISLIESKNDNTNGIIDIQAKAVDPT
jgi:hypothetical protein